MLLLLLFYPNYLDFYSGFKSNKHLTENSEKCKGAEKIITQP